MEEKYYYRISEEYGLKPDKLGINYGEFSFAALENIFLCVSILGDTLSVITVPDDAEVYYRNGVFTSDKINVIEKKKLDFKELIEHGANIHAGDDYALSYYSSRKSWNNIHDLVILGADVTSRDSEAFIQACYYKNINIIILMIEKGADVNMDNCEALKSTLNFGLDFEITKLLIEKGAYDVETFHNILLQAIKEEKKDCIDYILAKGADVNYNKGNAAYYCIMNLKYDMLYYLLNNGADINIDNGKLLKVCVIHGLFYLAKSLLDLGIIITPETFEYSILSPHRLNFATLFIDAGFDITNIKDSILLLAERDKNVDSILFLLERGAESNNLGGKTIRKCFPHCEPEMLERLEKKHYIQYFIWRYFYCF